MSKATALAVLGVPGAIGTKDIDEVNPEGELMEALGEGGRAGPDRPVGKAWLRDEPRDEPNEEPNDPVILRDELRLPTLELRLESMLELRLDPAASSYDISEMRLSIGI